MDEVGHSLGYAMGADAAFLIVGLILALPVWLIVVNVAGKKDPARYDTKHKRTNLFILLAVICMVAAYLTKQVVVLFS